MLLRFLSILLLVLISSACNQSSALPQPPSGGGLGTMAQAMAEQAAAPEAPTLKMPQVPGLPNATTWPANPMAATARPTQPPGTPGGFEPQVIKEHATRVQAMGQQMVNGWEQVAEQVAWIRQHETDAEILALTAQMQELIAQAQYDATQLAVTADDINYRIDHSEATTLRLSDDIGVMADRIGEMADRILWTEAQIGIMADRIVHSEHLINDGTQQTIDQMQETLDQIATLAQDVREQADQIRESLPPTETPGQQQDTAHNGTETTPTRPNQTNETSGQDAGNANGAIAITGGRAAGPGTEGSADASATAETCLAASPRRLEVLSRSIYLNSTALQRDLEQGMLLAEAHGQTALHQNLEQAETAASQIALLAAGLQNSLADVDAMTPEVCAQSRQAVLQIEQELQALSTALQHAQARQVNLPDARAQANIQRLLERDVLTVHYLAAWAHEMSQWVGMP